MDGQLEVFNLLRIISLIQLQFGLLDNDYLLVSANCGLAYMHGN